MVCRSGEVVDALHRRNINFCCAQVMRWKGGCAKMRGVGVFIADRWIDSVVDVVIVVVVCPLQPSSSVNSGCPGPESSILISSRWACPISSQVTDH